MLRVFRISNFSNSDLWSHLDQVQLLVQAGRDCWDPGNGSSHLDEDLLLLLSRPAGELSHPVVDVSSSLQVQDSTAQLVQVLSYRREGCAQVTITRGEGYPEVCRSAPDI